MGNSEIERITAGFQDYLGTNRLPDGSPAFYKLNARGTIFSIILQMTFLRGVCYCCTELGCHLALYQKRWTGLRKCLDANGLSLPDQLKVTVEAVIEEGSLIRPDSDAPPIPCESYEITERFEEAPLTES